MKRFRKLTLVLAPATLLGVAALFVAGAIAQVQPDKKPTPKPAAPAAQNDTEEAVPPSPPALPGAKNSDPARSRAQDAPATKAPAAPGTKTPAEPREKAAPGQKRDPGEERAPGDRRDPAQRGAERRPNLGVQFDAQGNQGIRVTTIDENSPAIKAGLKRDDRIISADGYTFAHPRQFQAYLASQSGRRVSVVIDRGGQRYTVQLPTFAQPDEGAWLGVYLEQGEDGQKGVRITRVYPAGPAARAGLYPGDSITQVEGKPVEDSAELIGLVQQAEVGKTMNFMVLRGDQEMKVPVVLASRGSFLVSQRFESQGDEGQYAQNSQNSDFDDLPPYAMQMEHDRRMAEQHQRIEEEIRLLREEIKQLREQLKK